MTVLVLVALLLLLTIVMWRRNDAVYTYRRSLLDQVHVAAGVDITRGVSWVWRYDAFRSESYYEMVWKLWRSIDSFYPDRSFLDPDSVQPEHVDR